MSSRHQSRKSFFSRCRHALVTKRSQSPVQRREQGIEPLEARIAPAVTIVGTLQGTINDTDGDGKADVGETIHYTEVIQNTGDTDATLVQVQNAIDAATSLVPGSILISPLAIKHSYNAAGNTALSVDATNGVKLGAMDLDGVTSFANLQVLAGTFTTSQGGTVTINADGSFKYVPQTGDENITDTFTYSIVDSDGLKGTGTVSMNLGEVVWYVDANYDPVTNGPSDGSSLKPYSSLTQITGAAGNDQAGDIIYIAEKASHDYDGNLTLLNGQRLYGSGVALSVNGITINSAGGQNTTFITTAANTHAITLGQGNQLFGITIGNTTGAGIFGSDFNSVSFSKVSIQGAGKALDLSGPSTATLDLETVSGTIDSLSVTSSTSEGIRLVNVGGSLTVTSGSIAGSSGDDIVVSGGNANLTFGVSITNTAGKSVDVTGHTGGTITFSGDITDTGGSGIDVHGNSGGTITFSGTTKTLNTAGKNAVTLSNNTGATINFSNGGLKITTTSGAGFSATGGGTISIATGTNPNIISSGTGTALNVTNTTIGASGLTFQSISANGAADGIILNNTGSTAGLTVTGTGAAGTGGTIQNIGNVGASFTDAAKISLNWMNFTTVATSIGVVGTDTDISGVHTGIKLTNATTVSLKNIAMSNSGQDGVTGLNVKGLKIEDSSFSNIGNAAEEHVIRIINLSDTAAGQNLIEDVTIDGNAGNPSLSTSGINIRNVGSTTLNDLTIRRVTIKNVEDGVRLTVRDSSHSNFLLTNLNMPGRLNGDGVDLAVEGANSPVANIIVQNSTFEKSGFGFGGVILAAANSGSGTWTVRDNTFFNNGGTAINIAALNDSNTVKAVVARNNIDYPGGDGTIPGNTNTATPGQTGIGIDIKKEDRGDAQVLVENNTISHAPKAVSAITRAGLSGQAGRLDVTVRNNTFTNNTGNPTIFDEPFSFDAGSSSTPVGTMVVNLTGNNSAPGTNGADSYRIRERPGATMFVQGITGAHTAAEVAAYIKDTTANGANNRTNGSTALVFVATGTYDGGTAIAPTEPAAMPLFFSPTIDDTPAPGDPGSSSGGNNTPVPPASDPVVQPPVSNPGSTGSGTPTDSATDGNLSQAELDVLVSAAIARWQAAGISGEQLALLQHVSFTVKDMPGYYLGEANGTQITLDVDGAGNGWFVDSTPLDDSEFAGTGTRLGATANGGAAGRVDALTTVMHEMGHVLGLDDSYASADRDNLMYGWVGFGERRVASAHQADGVTPHTHEGTAFALSPLTIGNLNAGSSVTVVFDAKVNNPFTNAQPQVSAQGTISGGNFSNVVTNTVVTQVDLPDVSVAVASNPSGPVTEDGAGTLVYTFTRTGDLSGALTVNFNVGGVAAFGSDYTQSGAASFNATTGTVTFAAGSATATVTIDPTADNTVEADESVILTLGAGTGYEIVNPSAATGTIANDDTDVSISVSPASVSEDGSGNLVYTFTRAGVTSGSLTVNFSVGGTAAFGTDFTQSGAGAFSATGGTVTFAPGATTATVTIDPTADNTVEGDETTVLTVTSGTGYNMGSTSVATGVISNDDADVTLSLSPTSVAEDGSGNLVYTFKRTGYTAGALTVGYTVGGTATFNNDYTVLGAASFSGTAGTVTFAAGSDTATVTIDPTPDTNAEPDETVALTLTGGTGYNATTVGAVTGTIQNDDTIVTVSLATATIAEDASGGLIYTFTRTGDTSTSLLVNFSAGGTATFTSDYTHTGATTFDGSSGTILIPIGQSSASVTLTPVNDTRVEGSETAILSVALGAGYGVGAAGTGTATGTITDNDTATVSLVSGTSSVGEGTASHNVGVQLVITANGTVGTGTLERAISVNLQDLLTGSATAGGSDYTFSTPQTVSFASGEAGSTKNVAVALVNDTRVEGNETINLALNTLSDGSNGQVTLGSTTAHTVTITDNDTATVSLVSGTSSVGEGTASHNVGVQLVITANGTVGTGTLERAISVNLQDLLTGSATAGGSDYTFSTPQTVSFASGEAGSTKNVAIALVNDTRVEGNETINLALNTLSDGSNGQVTLGSTTAHTVTITDNDTATVSLVSGTSSVGEGTASHNVGVQLVITANGTVGTGTLERAISVNLQDLLTGSATAGGSDYTFSTPQTVSFASGEAGSTKNVAVALVNDTRVEGNESINLALNTLSDGSNGQVTLGSTTAHTVTITDNDTATVSLVSGTSSVGEGTASHNVGVQLVITANGVVGSGTLDRAISVNLQDLLTGSATAGGSDYTFSTPQTVSFASGEAGSTKNVAIALVNDTRVEGNETINLALNTLSDGSNGQVSLGSTTAHTVTITDNDTATVSLVSGTSSVGEGTASHNVGVQLVITANGTVGTGTLERAVSVNLQDLLTGSATAGGSDYTFSTPQTVTFANGASSSTQNVAIALVNDTRVEGNETINLALNTLSDGSNGQVTLGSTTAHTVTITDNDTATVSLVSGTSSVGEGTASHNVGVQLVITANGTVGTGTLERAISVNLQDLLTGSATAGGSDYTFSTPQTVSFASGEAGSTKNVAIALVNDTRVEGNETINLALNTLSDGSNGQVTLGSTTAHTVTITDNDTATVSLVSGTSSVGEGTGSHNVGVQLVITANGTVGTGTLERAISVNLQDLLTGSATAGGSDYTFSTPQTVSFASGEAGSTKNVAIALVNDTRVEGNETINLALNTLSDGSNGQVTLGSTTAHTVTITDNDTATVSLVSGTSSVGEGTASHNVGVQLVITANGTVGTGTLERAVSVNLQDLLTGSATAGGSDYTFSTPQTVTFANGASSSTQNVAIALVNDTRVEGNETINLALNTLSDGSNGQVTLGSTTAHTVTITDNDTATVSLVSGTSSVGEGTASHNVGVQLVITANGTVGTGTLERAISVNLQDLLTGSATAGGSDYTFSTPQTVSFASGEAGSTKNVAIALVNDTRVEGNETINLALNTLSDGSNGQVTLGSTTAHTVTITDNDTATVSLVSGTSSVGEGTGSHNVGVQLVITANGTVGTGTLERAISVNLQDLLTGSATAGGSDYTFSTPQTVSFASGEAGSTKNVAIALVNDTRVEGNESINLALNTLSDGSNGQVTLGSTTAHTVTITDNDTATVSLVSGTSSVGEGTASHNVGVQLVITANGTVGTGTLERAISVNLQDLLTGSATAGGSDYTFSTPQTVSFASGEAGSTKNVAIALVNDTRVEGNETINLALNTLSDGSNGQVTLGSTTAHTVTITDNDTATVSLVSGTSSVGEGTGSHNVGVQLVITANGTVGTGTLERAISVNLQDLLTGSATAGGSDYTFSTPQTVTFASGEAGSTKNVSVALVNDTRVEGNETINLALNTLSDGSNGQVSLGSTTAHTVTITDNDTATISFTAPTSTVGEATGAHDVGVTLVITANGTVGAGTLERNVTVNVQDLLNGTAAGAGTDYTFSSPQTLTFAAGESGTTKTVSLGIVNDSLSEGDESIHLQLNNLVDGTGTQVSLATPTSHVVTIADNDIDLQVTRTESSDVVVAGSGVGNLTYVITVTNKGLSNASGVVLNENLTLPAGVTVQSVTPSSGNFAVTETPDGNWVLGNLAAGAQATLTVVLTVDSTAAEGTDVISGTAHLTTANQDIVNTTDDSATESTSIDRQVDLQITKDDGVTSITPGGALAYGINVKNVGPSNATGVVITETLPAGTTFNAGASTAGWTETAPGSGIFTLNLGTVAGNGSASPVTFAVNVANPAAAGLHEVVNTVTIVDDGTAGADLATGDNHAEDRNTLDAAPQLSLSITDDISSSVARGGLVYYTLTYSNVGNQDATGVHLVEHVPANATFVAGASDASWVMQSDGSYRLDVGNLAAGAAPQSVVFAVRVDSTIPAGVRELVNNGSIDDDGANALSDLNITEAEQTLIYQGIYVVSPGITLPKQGPASNIRVFDVATGSEFSFVAYEPTYRDSVRIAVGDINGDGFDDIITATRTGTGRVRVFDGVTGEQFSGAFAEINPFNGRAQKGAYVAAGDVTGDGHDDIIVGSALGGGTVKVYDGVTGSLLTSYEAFGKSYKGGVRLAVGDVDGDGVEEIIAGQGNFGNTVKVFSGVSSTAVQNIEIGGKNYRGGVDVAAGDVNGDGKADIITGRNSKSAPWVDMYSGADGAPLGRFLAFESGFRNGIRVAAADVNIDGIADIIVGAGYKGDSRVRIFNGSSAAAYEELSNFVAFPAYPDVSLFVAGTSPVPIVASQQTQPV
ncbi:Calx-beta domain-containing protein [Verrucomicrobiota bacterium sgz303538]